MFRSFSRYLVLALSLSLLAPFAHPASVQADAFTVNSTADSGPGSLREAMLLANTHSGDDVISFDPTLSGAQISITSAPLPPSTDNLVIDGSTLETPLTLQGPFDFIGWPYIYGLKCDAGIMTVQGMNTMGFTYGIGSAETCTHLQVGNDQIEEGKVHVDGALRYGVLMTSPGQIVNTTAGAIAPNERGIYIENVTHDAQIGSTGPFGRVTATNNSFNGLNVFNSENVRIINAVSFNNLEMGIRFKSSSGTIGGLLPEERVEVYDNRFYGISLALSAHDVQIMNVSTHGNHQSGIFIDSEAHDITIGGVDPNMQNTISDHMGEISTGITVSQGAENVVIQNNLFENNRFAIDARAGNLRIEDNHIQSTTSMSIHVLNTEAPVDNVIIARNSIESADTGIHIGTIGAPYPLTHVTIQNNQISNIAQDGIQIQAGDHINVWGNNVQGAETGLRVEASNVDMDASIDPTKKNIISQSFSCLLAKGDHLVFKGNDCEGGIMVTDGAHHNILGGVLDSEKNQICPIASQPAAQVLLSAGNSNTFRGNSNICPLQRDALAGENPNQNFIARPFDTTSNEGLSAPTVTSASHTLGVQGETDCALCIVDLYGERSTDGVAWLSFTQADAQGHFSFSGVGLETYENVILTTTNLNGSTSPSTSSISLTPNTVPFASGVTVAQRRDGSKKADIQIQNMGDADGDTLTVFFRYSINGGVDWLEPHLLSPSAGHGDQPGEVHDIPGQALGTSFNVVWDLPADLGATELNDVLFQVAPIDERAMGAIIQSAAFQVDTLAPAQPTLQFQNRVHDSRVLVRLAGGEPFTKVYTDGFDSGYVVDARGLCQAYMQLPNLGPKSKKLQIVDAFGNASQVIFFTVVRY